MTARRTTPLTCLFVEDDEAAREVGVQQLQRLGLRVVAANDGTDALQKLTSIKPDLLVTDLSMPRMDGITLTRLVKKLMPDLPVVACSAIYPTESGAAREMLRAGAEGFLAKPMRAGDLRDLVASVVDLPANTGPAARVPPSDNGLVQVPGVGAEFSYEQLVTARTKTKTTTVALVGASGRHLDLRATRGFVEPGANVQLELKGRVLVGDQVEDLKGRITLKILMRTQTNVRSEILRAQVLTATSVEAWEALREYLALRTVS